MNKKKLNGRSILELVFCSMFVVIGMFCGCLNLVDPKDSRYIWLGLLWLLIGNLNAVQVGMVIGEHFPRA